MFSELELVRDVRVRAEVLDKNCIILQRHIVTCLLKGLLTEKANKHQGHFIAVTRLKSIHKVKASNEPVNNLFRVVFNCRTFKPCMGEILQGVVYRVNRMGVFIKCGPIRYAYLSGLVMPGYRLLQGERPVFVNDELSRIDVGVVVLFRVLAVKWVENRDGLHQEYIVLASLEGDYLGPVSLPGTEGLDL